MQGMKYLDKETNKNYVIMVMTPEEAEDLTKAILDKECYYIDLQEEAETAGNEEEKRYWKKFEKKFETYRNAIEDVIRFWEE